MKARIKRFLSAVSFSFFAAVISPNMVTAVKTKHPMPLHNAVINGTCREALMHILTSGGAGVNEEDGNRMTPLHYAAKAGRWKMIVLLIDHGADVAAQDRSFKTPLHYAAESGKTLAVYKLLSKITDPRILKMKDKGGWTPDQCTKRGVIANCIRKKLCQLEDKSTKSRRRFIPIVSHSEVPCVDKITLIPNPDAVARDTSAKAQEVTTPYAQMNVPTNTAGMPAAESSDQRYLTVPNESRFDGDLSENPAPPTEPSITDLAPSPMSPLYDCYNKWNGTEDESLFLAQEPTPLELLGVCDGGVPPSLVKSFDYQEKFEMFPTEYDEEWQELFGHEPRSPLY